MPCSFFKNFDVYLEIFQWPIFKVTDSFLSSAQSVDGINVCLISDECVCIFHFLYFYSLVILPTLLICFLFFFVDPNIYIQLFKCFCLIITTAGLSLGVLLYIDCFLSFMGHIFLLLCVSYNFWLNTSYLW